MALGDASPTDNLNDSKFDDSSTDDSRPTRRLTILQLLGLDSSLPEKQSKQIVAWMSRVVGRPLTEEENETLQKNELEACKTLNNIRQLAGASSLFRAWATRGDFKFPFIRPTEPRRFDPNKFLIFRGSTARLLWHALRANIYLSFGTFVGSTVGAAYASVQTRRAIAEDPRLAQFREEFGRKLTRGMADGQSRDIRQNPRDLRKSEALGGSGNVSGVSSRAASDQNEPFSNSDPSNSSYESMDQRSQDEFADSSNVEARSKDGMKQQTSSNNTSGSTGSAWEKLRSGNVERKKDSKASKSSAQEDFDAMLERDRQGKEAGDSSRSKWD